ncbi:hypothetical protein [Parachitinimonas caeni]|uniref:Uncharacterized protein n=1 Tax=Parachitinimonas caeni TaxID=3031301 RepID=A0ABT7DU31_9NEIS|nr:hypothetical protein [Parachitinimonas caeni]MDK2123576.1 hypothetical protein [Parachitinimonas caeni]
MMIAWIGYLYVILMIAATSGSAVKGLSIAFFLGIFPTLIMLYLMGMRLRKKRAEEATLHASAGNSSPQSDTPTEH